MAEESSVSRPAKKSNYSLQIYNEECVVRNKEKETQGAQCKAHHNICLSLHYEQILPTLPYHISNKS